MPHVAEEPRSKPRAKTSNTEGVLAPCQRAPTTRHSEAQPKNLQARSQEPPAVRLMSLQRSNLRPPNA